MSVYRFGLTRRSTHALAAFAALFAAGALPVAAAQAQQATQQGPRATAGRVSGTVTDAATGAPVADAQVMVGGTSSGATTRANGSFTLANVPAGTYELRVQRIGYRARTLQGVVVRGGEETVASAQLTSAPLQLGGVVVSASRRAEKVTEAPATITSIGQEQLDEAVGNTFASALKEAKGVDFIQVGMTSVAINARGFNSSFNNRFLMVEDGRISVLPENGLPVGQFTVTPKVDLAGMEVLVGPGSALYGPDASSGVLSLRTKDPKATPGATLEVTGGNRSYGDIQGRYAGLAGNFGYKLAGEYQTANDWTNYLSYNAGGTVVAPGTTGSVRETDLKAPIDWKATVARGSGAVVYYAGANRLEINGGMSKTHGVGQTNVGRNQLDGWKYNVAQARFTTPHWFLNAYRAQSQSGQSYALNRYAGAQLAPANANLSSDSLRMLSDWPSDGRMYAAEAQGNYVVPMALNTATVFGVQFRDDVVSSARQWLTDRNTGKDISNKQTGVYAQTTTPVSRFLDVVLAGRYDKPSQYDAQWSPKAGVVLKPVADQSFRVTYNRAFKSPTILQTNFFIPDWTSIISIYGNTGGFQTVDAAGTVKSTYGKMVPESNKTWEFGYKGVFGDRLFLDGTYFRSNYQNFMSPLTIVGNPFASAAAGGPTYAVPLNNSNIPVNAQGRVVNGAGIQPIVLVYYNLGNARVSGVDLGLNLIAAKHVELRSTLSTVKIDNLTTPPGASPEATSLNSPTTKWTVGATAKDVGPVTGNLTWRNVNGYYFRSGSNTGVVPTFGSLDANLSSRLPGLQDARLSIGVSNLLSCTAQNVTYQTPAGTPVRPNGSIKTEERGCGFNRKHIEMVNMPQIGPMAFVGVRYNFANARR